ncbi:hypothetical protein CpB0367 [Chlamydia pneumoniae TW-183]|uniref:Uncharacterized protein n=1 Tax=Chlamydia pneumoniae TaxID=83558 RepID=A0ABM5LCI6_CHLPN|nr:hypothetical protein CpB0367 [Chlamydia pneumoniae TW-183]
MVSTSHLLYFHLSKAKDDRMIILLIKRCSPQKYLRSWSLSEGAFSMQLYETRNKPR